MTDEKLKLPSYAKATIFIIGLFALLSMLYIAKSIIVPLVFAIIIAIVLHPVVNFFVRIKINRVVAIVITLFLTFLVIAAFGVLFISQASRFSESLPILADKFTAIFNQTITWASGYFDINAQKIHEWFTNTKDALINTSSASIGKTLVTVGNLVVVLFLVPVYIFMLLYYHPILLEFIHRFFGTSNQSQVSEIVTQTKTVIQRYLVGLVIEAAIVATLNSVALLILGIEYAILLGIIGALLNVIPYIGGIIGVAIFMVVALVTKSPVYVLYVIVIYSTHPIHRQSLYRSQNSCLKSKNQCTVRYSGGNCRECFMGHTRYVSFHTTPCHCKTYLRQYRILKTLGIFIRGHYASII